MANESLIPIRPYANSIRRSSQIENQRIAEALDLLEHNMRLVNGVASQADESSSSGIEVRPERE